MKRFVIALTMVAAASGPLLAGEMSTKQTRATTGQVEASKLPLLDRIKTYSIRRDAGAIKQVPAEPRTRSGIEVNPWVVPSFH